MGSHVGICKDDADKIVEVSKPEVRDRIHVGIQLDFRFNITWSVCMFYMFIWKLQNLNDFFSVDIPFHLKGFETRTKDYTTLRIGL